MALGGADASAGDSSIHHEHAAHDSIAGLQSIGDGNVTLEEEYVVPAPERGDEYYEASAADGSWISYDNPRDNYRSPYLGGGSGKICVTLLNERGEVIEGNSVPNTTVTIPTGDSIDWHEHAGPMVVEYPLTDHYEWPLDADQFGTDPDLPQGDGSMDAHCIEIHGMPEDGGVVEYGEPRIDGEYADWIDVVGYVQQEHEAWDTDVDPIEDAVPHEDAGGWTYETDASHGQAVVVLQLDPPADAYPEAVREGEDDDRNATVDPGAFGPDEDDDGENGGTGSDDGENASDGSDGGDSNEDGSPGFTAFAAVVAVVVATLARVRR